MIKKLRNLINPKYILFYHKLWGILGAYLYRFPTKKMVTIGITGTDGKTTTCTLLYEILLQAKIKTGLCTSVEFAIDNKRWKNVTHKTTLGRLGLQKILRRMVKNRCTHCVIETSSHAIKQNRVWGVFYDLVTITNISSEHLDYHKSFDDYRNTKLSIIDKMIESPSKKIQKKVIVNFDDKDNLDDIIKKTCEIVYYSIKDNAQVYATNIKYFKDRTEFDLNIGKNKTTISFNLVGDFNIKNALSASALAFALGIDMKYIKKGLENIEYVPGRMEYIDMGQDFNVIIDFAMTEKGYRNILKAVKKITDNDLWVVFGCCGDRDKQKRKGLGYIAIKNANKVIITDDEPYTEDPGSIRKMIIAGVIEGGGRINENFYEIEDRYKAIKFALSNAKKGDTVIIPGMGDLQGRTIGNKIIEWDERKIIKSILE